MHVLHANWSGGKLHLWAESAALWARRDAATEGEHPFTVPADAVAGVLGELTGGPATFEAGAIEVLLPQVDGRPGPSARLAHAVGHASTEAGSLERPALKPYVVKTAGVKPEQIESLLESIERGISDEEGYTPLNGNGARRQITAGSTVRFYMSAARLAKFLLAQQRFVPALRQEANGDLRGQWQPWVSDEKTAQRVALLMAAMPPAARAAVDELDHKPWPIVESFLAAVVDAGCRRTLIKEDMREAISTRDPGADAQVAWLGGLLAVADAIEIKGAARTDMVKQVRRWISGLEDRGQSSAWKLMLRLSEPAEAKMLSDMEDPADNVLWPLTFHLQSQENPKLIVDAADVWLLSTDSVTIEGRRLDSPQELLLAELGRASRVYPAMEKALREAEPSEMSLNTRQAYAFLREHRPVLMEQGFGVQAPEWWDQPSARLGARLKLTSEALEVVLKESGPGAVAAAGSRLGLSTLVNYTWDIAIGGTTLSLAEFEKLASRRTPLIRINGQWVEVRPEDVKAAIRFIQENPGGVMRVGDAIKLAFGADSRATGVPIVGMEATGWVGAFFGEGMTSEQLPIVEPPSTFHGSLRPYQLRGVSWMSFLERFGFGPCLADDMGLGKTVQLLALLAYERKIPEPAGVTLPAGSESPPAAPAIRARVARPKRPRRIQRRCRSSSAIRRRRC
jgi:non-specific serine/threonine protein kinase